MKTKRSTLSKSLRARLLKEAREVSTKAYAPYSDFPVGCAVLDDTGKTHLGCNVENVSYGLTICAERSALFQMVASGSTEARCLVIYTPTPEPVTPCGACRQVIWELAREATIICICPGGEKSFQAAELLPHGFSL